MKVLQINAVYGTGSTGRIAQDIHTQLMNEGHDSHIMWAIKCVGADDSARFHRIGNELDHKIHALLRRVDGGQGFHSKWATMAACQKIKEIRPDVVHLHNLHSNYIHLPTLLDFLGKEHIPTLATMHDCWFFTGKCPHYLAHGCERWRSGCANCPLGHGSERFFEEKKRGFAGIDKLAVNGVSEWTTKAAAESPILGAAKIHRCIYNWVDTKKFYPRVNCDEIRAKYGIANGRKLILGVSQGWSTRKGLNEMLRLSDELKDRADIILVGEGSQVPQRENLKCIGFTHDQEELIGLYSAADVFANPSRMETFGLVTAEAMACGTPVVAYDNTGSHEIVGEGCGILVKDGNIQDFTEMTIRAINERKWDNEYISQWVNARFGKRSQVNKYIELYEEMADGREYDGV